jgi:uncharacterized protein (TIGR03437 family)
LVPAVGRGGNSAPLQTFAELLAGIGSDGSRAHSLTETCPQGLAAAPQLSAVTNAATFVGGAVSAGEMIVIFGANLAGNVSFDGVPVKALYASPAQINVTVPYTVSGSTTTVRIGGAALELPVVGAAPGIFAAVAGAPGILTLYGTGGGAITADSPALLKLASSVTVNGEPAEILFAGVAPGLPEGANQVNLRLPAGAGTGSLSIVWTVGAAGSNTYRFAQ